MVNGNEILSTYRCLNKVAEGRAGLKPVRFTAKVLVELLDALVESHVQDGLLVQNIQQIVKLSGR